MTWKNILLIPYRQDNFLVKSDNWTTHLQSQIKANVTPENRSFQKQKSPWKTGLEDRKNKASGCGLTQPVSFSEQKSQSQKWRILFFSRGCRPWSDKKILPRSDARRHTMEYSKYKTKSLLAGGFLCEPLVNYCYVVNLTKNDKVETFFLKKVREYKNGRYLLAPDTVFFVEFLLLSYKIHLCPPRARKFFQLFQKEIQLLSIFFDLSVFTWPNFNIIYTSF